jgi:hypothetical protein
MISIINTQCVPECSDVLSPIMDAVGDALDSCFHAKTCEDRECGCESEELIQDMAHLSMLWGGD